MTFIEVADDCQLMAQLMMVSYLILLYEELEDMVSFLRFLMLELSLE